MAVQIREISTPADLKRFVNFQFSLYQGNEFWVPPLKADELKALRRDKNPAFDFCDASYWLAYVNGRVAGRIAGIINRKYNDKWEAKAARFGWVDFVDRPEVSAALFETVERWAQRRGMDTIHGPLGFTDMDAEGTLIEGFEEQSTFGALYNFSYYPTHIEHCGYAKDADWVEFEMTVPAEIPERVNRIADAVLRRNNLTILELKRAKDLLPYTREIFHVLNAAYTNLYGFVELSERQIEMYVKQYFTFIVPEYISVVLDADGRVAGFGISMPSLTQAFQKCNGSLFPFGFWHVLRALRARQYMDLYLIAVRPELQNKGVNAILMRELNKAAIRNGVVKVETNRELESNTKVQAQWKYYDHRQHKRRRCYKKDLTTAI